MLLLFWSNRLCCKSLTLQAFLRNSSNFFWISFLKLLVLSKWFFLSIDRSFRKSFIETFTLLAAFSRSIKSGAEIEVFPHSLPVAFVELPDEDVLVAELLTEDVLKNVCEFFIDEEFSAVKTESVWSGDVTVFVCITLRSRDWLKVIWEGFLLPSWILIDFSFSNSATASEWAPKLVLEFSRDRGVRGVRGDSKEI